MGDGELLSFAADLCFPLELRISVLHSGAPPGKKASSAGKSSAPFYMFTFTRIRVV